MNFFSKLVIAILIILSIFYLKDNFFKEMSFEFPFGEKEAVETKQAKPEPESEKPAKPVAESSVKIYFAKEKNETTSLISVKRKFSAESAGGAKKIEYAVSELLNGPSSSEKNSGSFSEIPQGTKLLAVKEDANSIIVDLSEDFQYGGGTQSQYIRVKQLIKTILAANPKKPVYLYLNGQKADVIGGEGLILNQPLSENSLND